LEKRRDVHTGAEREEHRGRGGKVPAIRCRVLIYKNKSIEKYYWIE